jgi:hypothetical protein
VQALHYNQPWQFIRKNVFILGAATYNTSLPPVGHPRLFQSMAHIDEVMDNASYDQRHAHQLGVQAIVHNQPWQFIRKNFIVLGSAAYNTSLPPTGLENPQQSTYFGAMVSLFYLSCFCIFLPLFFLRGPISTSCFKTNPFLISAKQRRILCQNQVLHGDYVIFFACSQSACV